MWKKLKDIVGINENSDTEEYDYIAETEISETPTNSRYNEKSVDSEEEPRSYRRRYQELSNTGTDTVINSTPRSNNVIGMPGINQASSEVVVIEPHSFAEMPKVIQILKERRSVVLNLNVMDPEEAQRAVDFVAGGTYAIDGNQERIGESIFLFTPNSVKVSTLSGIVSEITESETPKIAKIAANPSWGNQSSRLVQ
jgi:cell division inhibitor SepF